MYCILPCYKHLPPYSLFTPFFHCRFPHLANPAQMLIVQLFGLASSIPPQVHTPMTGTSLWLQLQICHSLKVLHCLLVPYHFHLIYSSVFTPFIDHLYCKFQSFYLKNREPFNPSVFPNLIPWIFITPPWLVHQHKHPFGLHCTFSLSIHCISQKSIVLYRYRPWSPPFSSWITNWKTYISTWLHFKSVKIGFKRQRRAAIPKALYNLFTHIFSSSNFKQVPLPNPVPTFTLCLFGT